MKLDSFHYFKSSNHVWAGEENKGSEIVIVSNKIIKRLDSICLAIEKEINNKNKES
jgi:hypothetical protein